MSRQNNSLKLLVVGSCALLVTFLSFCLMVLLITQDISSATDLSVEQNSVIPVIPHSYPEERPPQRLTPQKITPAEPPPDREGVEISLPSRIDLHAERPIFGSIADIIGPNDITLSLDAPALQLTPLYIVQPVYPLVAAMKDIEGFVIVQFSVRPNGTVQNPIVISSEPRELFDQAALSAASKTRFKPRKIADDRQGIEKVQMKFAFSLESAYDVSERFKTPESTGSLSSHHQETAQTPE